MLFPHVLSTEAKFETTMGFSHTNSLKSMSRANGSTASEVVVNGNGDSDGSYRPTSLHTPGAFEMCTAAEPTAPALDEIQLCRQRWWQQRRRRRRRRPWLHQLLLWRQSKPRCQQLRQLHIHSQSTVVPFESCQHHANSNSDNNNNNSIIQSISTILCINQKTQRSTNRNAMPSGQVFNVRWPNDKLCVSTEIIDRRPRAKCDCVPLVAMARSTICKRTQADTNLSKRNRSHLCVLQSNPLVPDMSNRYSPSTNYPHFPTHSMPTVCQFVFVQSSLTPFDERTPEAFGNFLSFSHIELYD